jgi:hypothetical protein
MKKINSEMNINEMKIEMNKKEIKSKYKIFKTKSDLNINKFFKKNKSSNNIYESYTEKSSSSSYKSETETNIKKKIPEKNNYHNKISLFEIDKYENWFHDQNILISNILNKKFDTIYDIENSNIFLIFFENDIKKIYFQNSDLFNLEFNKKFLF